ncbi:AMP-binding enzyme family protein [Mycobacterium xenopi 4042]|uniref:AMP-binding enzyme family protein n=1 Tax=Mycobacterium xenopi 4042 TaxID=1299334 RepID=X8CKX5_MYCXE|nr:AMP-binding enzyme family protein [Mycobacterium xenopi 4042]
MTWPHITGVFNWATDWFDVIARGNDHTALWIVDDSGGERRLSFAEMADRSDRVAGWLQQLGVGKGDRVLLMLGNQVELWEAMLAVAKLGAVVMPTTAALGPSTWPTGSAAAVPDSSSPTPPTRPSSPRSRVTIDASRWAPGRRVALLRRRRRHRRSRPLHRSNQRRRSDADLFHVGNHQHTQTGSALPDQLPGRPFVDDGLDRCAARRCALGDQPTGLGQACLELFFRTVDRRGDDLRLQLPPL